MCAEGCVGVMVVPGYLHTHKGEVRDVERVGNFTQELVEKPLNFAPFGQREKTPLGKIN